MDDNEMRKVSIQAPQHVMRRVLERFFEISKSESYGFIVTEMTPEVEGEK